MTLKPCASSSGFTIVELIIAIIVISILATIGIPVGRKITDSIRLKTTTNRIKNLFKVAQVKAMADPQMHCGVYLFSGTGSSESFASKEMAIFFDVNSDYLYNTNIDQLYMGTHGLPKGITLEIPSLGGITNNVVIFRSDGSAKFGGSVVLINSHNQHDTIHVLASTGRIKSIHN